MPTQRRPGLAVYAVKSKGRANYRLKIVRWIGDRKEVTWKSAGTRIKREAERAAGRLEASLKKKADPKRIRWLQFGQYYIDNHLCNKASQSVISFRTSMFYLAEQGINYLDEVDAEALMALGAALRYRGATPETVKTHLARLRAAVNWGVHHQFAPAEAMIHLKLEHTRGIGMPDRPVTGEEFERMLEAVPEVIKQVARHHSWRFYLRGMWLSGLRRGESLQVSWDRDDALRIVDLDRRYPMLRIPAALEKGRRDRLYPLTPDFVEFLRKVPKGHRRGWVFCPLVDNGRGGSRVTRSVKQVGDTVSAIGRAARVIVEQTDSGPRFATLKAFRRAFGHRWAPLVPEQTLMTLMRHESIETTRKYYVGLASQAISEQLQLIVKQQQEQETDAPITD